MVEMTVFGLALDEDSQVPILILKEVQGDVILPVWIGAMEAMAISMVLNKVATPRPMTHDLILGLLHKLEVQLVGVQIISVLEGTYYAELVTYSAEKGETCVDCRPSDAIALALRANVAIRVTKDVLEVNQNLQRGMFQEVIKGEDSEKWTEILERFNLDDLKYKM